MLLKAFCASYTRIILTIILALKLKPGDALTYKRRADVRGKLSKRDEAIEDYKMAIVIQTSTKQK